MDFGTKYLTYNEYKELGGALSENAFNLLEYKSRLEIDKLTFNRVSILSSIPSEVKLCIYDLILKINSYASYDAQDKSVSSESSDGYSISYTSPNSELEKAKNKELEDIIDTYLSNISITINFEEIPILYRGVD